MSSGFTQDIPRIADLPGMDWISRRRVRFGIAGRTSFLRMRGGDPGLVRLIRSAMVCLIFLITYGWWQLQGWGGAEHRTLVGGLFFVPLNAFAVLTAWGAVRRSWGRPRMERFWRLVSAALLAELIGDVMQTYHEVVEHARPFPSLVDVPFLAFYVLILIAILRFPSESSSIRRQLTLVLDCALVAIAGAVPIWFVSLAPIIVAGGQSGVAMAVSVAYPLGDMVLLVGLASLLLRAVPAGLRLPLSLFGVGMVGFVLTDLIYSWVAVHGTYAGGDHLDVGWVISLAFFAVAGSAYAPIAREDFMTQGSRGYRRHVSWMPYVGLATTLSLVVWTERHDPITTLALFVAAAVLALLVSLRQLLVQTELLGTQRELRTVQAERALLLDSTMRRGENERVRIAAELHDGPVQRLAALGYLLERAVRVGGRGDTERAGALATEAMTELRAEVEGLRRLMSNLRPPALDESGLENALRDHLSAVFAGTGVAVGLVSELGEEQLPAASKTALYRVAQEALLNIREHAAAHQVQVRLARREGATVLSISDDGVGFSPAEASARLREGHFGLVGMRERVELAGGNWHLETASGSGTQITASVPDEPDIPGSAETDRANRQRVPA